MGGSSLWTADVKEVVEFDHVARHVVRPLQDLRADVHKEGVAGPAAEDHDPFLRMVHEEEAHGGARTKGAVANVMRVKAKGLDATVKVASVP